MEVEGIYYIAQVKQKEQAWRMYKEAVHRNQTAGHIDVEVRVGDLKCKHDEDELPGQTQQQVPCERQHGGSQPR